MSVAGQKDALRERMLALRRSLSEEEAERASEEITRRVRSLGSYERARTRLLFASFRGEVSTEALIRDTLKSRARLVLPRVVGMEEALALHEVRDPETELCDGAFGIREPKPEVCPEVSVYDIDFVLVPGLAFDRRGGRLGYGGGFFDYILGLRHDLTENGAAVAVAFSVQIVDEVPRESWDVPVPLIATEDELINTRESRG